MDFGYFHEEESEQFAFYRIPQVLFKDEKFAKLSTDGCFWHRHEGCKDATTPKTRTEFWLDKFDKNVKNDQIKQEKLRELGWKVIVIWECELKRNFQKTMDKVEKELT